MNRILTIIIIVLFGLVACEERSSKKVDNLQLAEFYADNGTYSLALKILHQEIQKTPDNITAIKMLSAIYYDLEYFLDADKVIARAISLGCDSEDCEKLFIDILIANHKVDDAERHLNSKSINKNSDFYKLRNAQIQYSKNKNLKKLEDDILTIDSVAARKYWLKALYENSRFVEVYNSKEEGIEYSIDELLIYSRTTYILEKYEESEKILLEVRLKDKSDIITRRKIEAVEQLVKVSVALGKISEADIIYQAFLKNNEGTGYSAFNNALGELKSSNFDAAIRNIEGMVKANPTNQQSSQILALAYYGKKDYKSVISILKSFKQKLDVKGRLLLAISYINSGNPDAAVDILSKNIADDISRLALARAALMTGDREKSISLTKDIKISDTGVSITEQFAALLYALEMDDILIKQFESRNNTTDRVKLLVIDSYIRTQQHEAAKLYAKRQSNKLVGFELQAYVEIKLKNLNKAISIYERIIIERDNKKDYIKLAGLYLQDKQSEKVYGTIVKGFEIEGDNRLLFRLVYSLLAFEQNQAYINWLESVTAQHKDYKSIQVMLASNDIRSNRKHEVIERLSKFESDGDIQVSLLLAIAKNDENQDYLIKLLEKSLSADFSMRIAQILLDYYFSQNDLKNLGLILDTVEEEQGLSIYTAPLLAKGYLKLRKFDKAHETADFLAKNGQKYIAYDIKGNVSVLKNEFDDALAFYKKIINELPKETSLIKYFTIKLSVEKYEIIKTLSEADSWIENYPDMSVLRQYIATKYIDKNNTKAIKHFKILLDKFPKNIEILNNYAWVLLSVDSERALALSEKAYSLNPDNLNVADTYILALQKNNKYNKAIELLNHLIDKNPGNKMLQKRLSDVNKAS